MVPITKAILLSSIKGGVGKTTLAVNLARELGSVTVVDADITSSNFASVMGLEEKSEVTKEHEIKPVSTDGVDIYSVETCFSDSSISLLEGKEAGIVESFLRHGINNSGDFLIVDCPPGASTSFRSILEYLSEKNIERTAIAVAQPNSLSDLDRMTTIFSHLKLPIAGYVENMSEGPFGENGVKLACEEYGGTFLGKIPLVNQDERDEVVKPVAENIVERVQDDEIFMDAQIHPEAGFWDKMRDGLNIGLSLLSKEVPIGKLGQEYGFKENHLTLEVDIKDISRKFHLGVRGDSIRPIKNPKNLVGGIKIPLREMRDALKMEREVIYAPTGEKRKEDYSLVKAISLGLASIWSDEEELERLGINLRAWDLLIILDFILREAVGKERIEQIAKEAGVDKI